MTWGQILSGAASAAVVAGVIGLAFGLLGDLPWEEAKVDAGAFAIVGGCLALGRGIRARFRAGRPAE